jgi:hypothetical protein
MQNLLVAGRMPNDSNECIGNIRPKHPDHLIEGPIHFVAYLLPQAIHFAEELFNALEHTT